MQNVTAIYENGMLRPLRQLNLREHETVQIQISAPADQTADVETKILQTLSASGLITMAKDSTSIAPVSDQRREQLAQIFSTSQSLAQLIREEREQGW